MPSKVFIWIRPWSSQANPARKSTMWQVGRTVLESSRIHSQFRNSWVHVVEPCSTHFLSCSPCSIPCAPHDLVGRITLVMELVKSRCSPSDHSQSHSCHSCHSCHTWGTKPGSTINTLRGSHPSVRPSCSAFHDIFSCNTCCWKCHWDIYIYIYIYIFWYIGMLLLARDPLSGTMPSLHSPQVVDFPSWNKSKKRLERQGSNIDSLAAQFAPIETRMRLSSTVGLSSIPLRAGLHRWWTPVHPPQHWAHARYCPPPGHANICQYTFNTP